MSVCIIFCHRSVGFFKVTYCTKIVRLNRKKKAGKKPFGTITFLKEFLQLNVIEKGEREGEKKNRHGEQNETLKANWMAGTMQEHRNLLRTLFALF